MVNDFLKRIIETTPEAVGPFIGSMPFIGIDYLSCANVDNPYLDIGLGSSLYAGLANKFAASAVGIALSLGPDLANFVRNTSCNDSHMNADLGNLLERGLFYGIAFLAGKAIDYWINKPQPQDDEPAGDD